MKKILILFSFLVFSSAAFAQTAAQNGPKWQQLTMIQNNYLNTNPGDTQAQSLVATYDALRGNISNPSSNITPKQVMAARYAVIKHFNSVSPQHKATFGSLLMNNKRQN